MLILEMWRGNSLAHQSIIKINMFTAEQKQEMYLKLILKKQFIREWGLLKSCSVLALLLLEFFPMEIS